MKKIFLFGDSITAGYREGEIEETLTVLISDCFPKSKVVNAGIPGDTTREGLKRIEQHILSYQPDIVVVFFGANDMAVSCDVSVTEYGENLHRMIEEIGISKVLLITPPYVNQYLRSEDRPLSSIESYTEKAQEIAKTYQMPTILLKNEMLKQDADSWLQEDGLHFSYQGYIYLKQLICQKIKKYWQMNE